MLSILFSCFLIILFSNKLMAQTVQEYVYHHTTFIAAFFSLFKEAYLLCGSRF